ncbi:hypothetical protein IO99_18130 [Clostridium sulfidigenes]|uniref:Uncharacterized protein n=1 Tax=Clostridium sulfidigenes TaxID=318464 RepID=A0A084J7B1_9CLOT|nr:hypothetical protein [Clostridium sulfidigenes]KEZ84845.1 hypothetical protein IO99_18130 [Clostridium sulfidigenes]
MKRFTVIFIILIILVLNTFTSTCVFAENIFTEGVYKATDFNVSPNESYIVQNVSANESVFLTLYDENQLIIQSLRLEPKSAKYNLIPLKPEYRIVIVGNGQIFIDKGTQ